jgi:hypothetical protein
MHQSRYWYHCKSLPTLILFTYLPGLYYSQIILCFFSFYLQFKEPVVPETFNREVREGLVIEGTKAEADVSALTFANAMNDSNDRNNAIREVNDDSKGNSDTKKQLMNFRLFSDEEALQLRTNQVPTN